MGNPPEGSSSDHSPVSVAVSRRRLRKWLAVLVVAVVAVHLLVVAVDRFDVVGETFLRRFGNMAAENTLPTWLSALLLLAVSGGFWTSGRLSEGESRPWNVLAGIFVLLSVDEVASFHEATIGPLRDLLGVSGWLYYAWVVPATLALIVLGALLWRFVMGLPSGLRNQLIVAAVLYVGGAVGMEMPAGMLSESGGRDSPGYYLLAAVEEALEMVVAAVAVDALFGHVLGRTRAVSVVLID